MFENLNSLSVSGAGRTAGLRLESLEDRTTPAAIVTAANPFASVAFNVAALNGAFVVPISVDGAFLVELARVSALEVFLGTTEANQGSNPQVRAFGQQVATSYSIVFNQVATALNRASVPLQFTAIDQALAISFPTLTPPLIDSQFLFFSSIYGLEFAAAAQTETLFGTNVAVRVFAQSQFAPLQSQLQFTSAFLAPNSTSLSLASFGLQNGFGPFTLVTAGTNPGAFGTSTTAGTPGGRPF